MLVTLYKLNNCPCLKFDQDESTFSKYYRIKKVRVWKNKFVRNINNIL